MKRNIIILFIVIVLLITAVGCNDKKENNENNKTNNKSSFTVSPDIKIEDLKWKFGEGEVKSDSYVLLQYTNNSTVSINYFEIKFKEKNKISKKEKEEFYDDIRKSQGFDDEYFDAWKESKEKLNESITMYGNYSSTISPGETSPKIKCYYYGGWTSKNVLHSNLVEPEKIELHYIKDEVEYIQYYNFKTKQYDIEQNTED